MRILKSTFSIILFITYSFVFAQESNVEEVKNQASIERHQLGFSIDLNKNISLLYRNRKPNNLSIRANLNTKSSASFIDTNLTNFTLWLTLSGGVEKHLLTKKKVSAYFGAEASARSLIYGFGIRRTSLVLSGLTGVKLRANDKIYFFAEALFGLEFNSTVRSPSIFWAVRNSNNFNFGVFYTLGKAV